jgi:flagellar L-ring protein precursor FlgH
MGFQSSLASILPSAVNPASMLNVGSTATSTNAGSTGRTETLTTTLAAVITQVLPNGNLVISGRQEMRVNFEMRELTIQGIIRPEDLSTSNSVNYQKIAEARIYYGGRGVASELAQPRYGHEVLDILFPF